MDYGFGHISKKRQQGTCMEKEKRLHDLRVMSLKVGIRHK
jgi:hypothetical protein